jgi:hypothetical protein
MQRSPRSTQAAFKLKMQMEAFEVSKPDSQIYISVAPSLDHCTCHRAQWVWGFSYANPCLLLLLMACQHTDWRQCVWGQHVYRHLSAYCICFLKCVLPVGPPSLRSVLVYLVLAVYLHHEGATGRQQRAQYLLPTTVLLEPAAPIRCCVHQPTTRRQLNLPPRTVTWCEADRMRAAWTELAALAAWRWMVVLRLALYADVIAPGGFVTTGGLAESQCDR